MKKVFLGFVFIYLNFTLRFNQVSLNIIPDFIGYIFLFAGAKEIEMNPSAFRRIRVLSAGMAVYSVLLWGASVFGLSGSSWWDLLSAAATVVSFYISWLLIRAVLDLQKANEAELYGERLSHWWKGLVIVRIGEAVVQFSMHFISFRILGMLVASLLIAGLLIVVLYLLAWNRTAAAYQELMNQEPKDLDEQVSESIS